jgi:hypothetical protein
MSLKDLYLLRFDDETLKVKSDFKKVLKEECKKKYNIESRFDNNKPKVRNTLLLFNIATIMSDKKSTNRFSFAQYIENNWDIEHITPQTPKEIEDKEQRKAWLEQFESSDFISEDFKSKINDIDNAIKDTNWEDIFKLSIDELNKQNIDINSINSIDNLTLLSDTVNRGIGNEYFHKKRQLVIDYSKKGCFIPTCSMNVFLKLYNPSPKNLYFWTADDRQRYTEEIKQQLNAFCQIDGDK